LSAKRLHLCLPIQISSSYLILRFVFFDEDYYHLGHFVHPLLYLGTKRGTSSLDQETFMSKAFSLFHQAPIHLNPPLFIFKKYHYAAAHNTRILESAGFDLGSLIRAQHPSQISFGSEFRQASDLEGLLEDHPLWPRLKEILLKRASFPLSPMSQADRNMDIAYHRNRGNHKSLEKYSSFIEPVITEDIERGFALPLLLDVLEKTKGTLIAPLGCHKQSSINAFGELVPKYRLTHDQSFPGLSGLSVNIRVRKEFLPPIMYSFVLSRLIHYIVNVWRILPSTKIYICKVDMDAAYRRCSLSCETSWESLTIFDGLVLVALRLTFGGAPCPNLWGVISETIADVANTIFTILWVIRHHRDT
jgi:hypothetical protein